MKEEITIVWYSNSRVEFCTYFIDGGSNENQLKQFTISLN